ncbi:MAG TPA: hypothetical protein VFH97_06185, partial [Gemmatimonadales bacterium]|nr:hypothetical protein [Gemmatimonadales bacterium]
KVLLAAAAMGLVVGVVFAQESISRYRRALFSSRPLKRLSALGYLSAHPSVDTVRLLRDYIAWEQQPMLRRRAEAIARRMEAKLA